VWWILAAVLVGVELTSGTFYLLVYGLAAAAAGVAAWLGAGLFMQLLTAGVIATLGTLALRHLSMLAVLMIGLLKTSTEGNDLAVAERASNPDTLHRLFEQSRTGEADSFGVPLFLAQNPNTPPEILAKLAKHNHPAVRVHVAQHPMTPQEVVAGLSNDCASFVREAVEKRLGPNKALQQARTPSGVCAAER
jgi:hypothetical protein